MNIFLVLYLLVSSVSALNILVLFPHPGASHFYVFEPMFKTLAARGHSLTIVSYAPKKTAVENIRDVGLDENLRSFQEVIHFEMLAKSRKVMWFESNNLGNFARKSCEAAYDNDNLKKFLKEENKFDVILMEFFNSNCLNGLIHKYKAPVIGLSSCQMMPWHGRYFGTQDNPAYTPTTFMDYTDKLTFIERVENTIMKLYCIFTFDYIITPHGNELSKKHWGIDLEEKENILYNTSLMLLNTHPVLNLARSYPPNVIEIGGIHVPSETKKLPKNIEKWIDGSSDGVIYFSLGSMIKGHTFPTDKRKEFLKAFGKLSQTVLWKWENETMEGKPDNVMIQKWMPQFDILCHPNVKAFISHGGLLGVTEAVHCGVPVIVMPQFGDQFTNAKALESVGGGVILHLSEATEESISKALKKVLSSKFRQQAKELSERFRDRPMSPMDTAIYWVEYVARHKGAPHMRTAAVNMPFYQYYLLDVISFLILIVSLTLYIVVYVLKTMLKLFLSSSRKVKIN
ncbi:unnamed protein product [Brassicogethes aeneus]|uniref:UDP-glucuronosyltransferase n=1 Tax=Brassicogethes aeneus TaxID=1431903 RepID=A0A9P0BGH9_BRAAE|nr:unnamed protein product [Brassicogethes aeneus]